MLWYVGLWRNGGKCPLYISVRLATAWPRCKRSAMWCGALALKMSPAVEYQLVLNKALLARCGRAPAAPLAAGAAATKNRTSSLNEGGNQSALVAVHWR